MMAHLLCFEHWRTFVVRSCTVAAISPSPYQKLYCEHLDCIPQTNLCRECLEHVDTTAAILLYLPSTSDSLKKCLRHFATALHPMGRASPVDFLVSDEEFARAHQAQRHLSQNGILQLVAPEMGHSRASLLPRAGPETKGSSGHVLGF